MADKKVARKETAFIVRAVIWTLLLLAPIPSTGLKIAQSQGLQELIRNISEKQSRIETLTAIFSQRRETALVQEPLLSSGIVKFKRPSRVFFAYTEPTPMEIYLDGKRVNIYDPARSQAERYTLSPVSRVGFYLQSVTRIFQQTLEQLTADYSIRPLPPDRADCYRFRLHPRKEAMEEVVKEVELRIDKASGAILTFDWIEPSQERLILEFQKLQINPPLTDQDLKINLPPSGQIEEKSLP
jgi:outer membrane lipoprotein-sorting protein